MSQLCERLPLVGLVRFDRSAKNNSLLHTLLVHNMQMQSLIIIISNHGMRENAGICENIQVRFRATAAHSVLQVRNSKMNKGTGKPKGIE